LHGNCKQYHVFPFPILSCSVDTLAFAMIDLVEDRKATKAQPTHSANNQAKAKESDVYCQQIMMDGAPPYAGQVSHIT
jgi:hypothetical protein